MKFIRCLTFDKNPEIVLVPAEEIMCIVNHYDETQPDVLEMSTEEAFICYHDGLENPKVEDCVVDLDI